MASFGYRFKHFVKRHERWFTFAGAFIVVMTFVVKEGLGEYWHHIADAIDAAQYAYSINVNFSNQQQVLASLSRDVLAIKDHALPLKQNAELRLASYSPEYQVLVEHELLLNNIAVLVDTLPSAQSFREEMRALHEIEGKSRSGISALISKRQSATLDYLYADPKNSGLSPELRKRLFASGAQLTQEAIEDERHLRDVILAWQSRVETLRANVQEVAERTRRENSYRSQVAWWITTFLFIFGWGLGLLGKIYGVSSGGE